MKRLFSDIDDDMPVVSIKLSEGDPIEVPLMAVQLFSSCARALPMESAEWDITGLRIDGSPVTRAAVQAWLQHLAQLTDGVPHTAEDDEPVTAKSLYQLLVFADAVGSRRGLVLACASQLDGLQLQVQLGEQQLALELDQGIYFTDEGSDDEGERTMQLGCEQLGTTLLLGEPVPAANEVTASIQQQMSTQLEQLMFVAYKLDLEQLIDKLHAFIRLNTMDSLYIVKDIAIASMFSTRVLAALGGSRHAQKVWSSSMHGEPCSFSTSYTSCLFAPVDPTQQECQPFKFDAKLQRDWMGLAKGSTVSLELDLFDAGVLTITQDAAHNYFSVHLRLSDENVKKDQ